MRRYCFVATAYAVRDGKVLLLKHKKLGMWLPPGGHVDDGETPDQAALRELKEEAGLDADFLEPRRGPDPSPRVEYLHPPQHTQVEEIPGHNHHIDFIYYLRARPGAVTPGPGESGEWRWHDADELGEPQISAEVRESGRLALAFAAKAR